MAGTGFFKGEKKKAKKGKEVKRNSSFNAPVFTLPEVISKKREKYT